MAQQPSHKPAYVPPAGGSTSASAGLRKGRPVPIPSSALPALEQAHGPGRILFGKVKGKDESQKGCVQVKCVEDPRTFSFETLQVRQWLAMYPLQVSTNTFVEADKLDQTAPTHDQGDLPPSSKRARMGSSSPGPAGNDTSQHISGTPSEQEEIFLPPPGPPKKGVTKRAEVADLLGKDVDVPGSVFHDNAPGVYFRAHVTAPDSGHASAVVLRLLIHPKNRYYFHASEVRHWIRVTQARAAGRQGDGSAQNAQDGADETLAAEVLAHMSGSSSDSPCAQLSSADAAPQPPPPPSNPLHSGAPQEKGPGQKGTTGKAVPSPAGRHLPLQWSPSELLVQYPSVLPPSLAEQLAKIANACGGAQQADTAAAEAAAAAAAAAAEQTAQQVTSQEVKKEGVAEMLQ